MLDWSHLPVGHRHIVVEAPDSVTLAYEGFGELPRPQKRRRQGLQRLSWHLEDVPEGAGWVEALGLRNQVSPQLAVGTESSWLDLGASYAAQVEERIDASGIETLVAEAREGDDPTARATRALRAVQREIRYTGVKFGQQAVRPYLPGESLARGFGDCKDQATAVVAILRELDIPAWLALLDSGTGPESPMELPALSRFDHAIVVAMVHGEQVWIDPTVPGVPFGLLPEADQGRRALIVRPGEAALVTTPTSVGRYTEARTIDLRGGGFGRLEETTGYGGWVSGSVPTSRTPSRARSRKTWRATSATTTRSTGRCTPPGWILRRIGSRSRWRCPPTP